MTDSPTILIDELAAMLGRPGPQGEAWVRRKYYWLLEEHGFPNRLVTGWAWPRRLVEIWILSGGVPLRRTGRSGNPPAGAANDDLPGNRPAEDPLAYLVAAQHRYLTDRIGSGAR